MPSKKQRKNRFLSNFFVKVHFFVLILWEDQRETHQSTISNTEKNAHEPMFGWGRLYILVFKFLIGNLVYKQRNWLFVFFVVVFLEDSVFWLYKLVENLVDVIFEFENN